MTEAIEKLTFKDRQVRTIKRGSELLWCGADVGRSLELDNYRTSLAKLDDDEKSAVQIMDGRQGRSLVFVTEAGLYKLIMRSNKPVAREFQRWVCHEVLPSIRRTGGYVAGGGQCVVSLEGAQRRIARGMLHGARQMVMDCMKALAVGVPPFGRMTADDFREVVEWCIRRMETQKFDPKDNECPPWAVKAAETAMESQIVKSLAGDPQRITVEIAVREVK
ncbi:MAG: hypothetical protein IJJ33_11420 [Victivallales bacterium]|nr:hypothetical protein [Victivallales bacterium]